jgi:hypothetical protein
MPKRRGDVSLPVRLPVNVTAVRVNTASGAWVSRSWFGSQHGLSAHTEAYAISWLGKPPPDRLWRRYRSRAQLQRHPRSSVRLHRRNVLLRCGAWVAKMIASNGCPSMLGPTRCADWQQRSKRRIRRGTTPSQDGAGQGGAEELATAPAGKKAPRHSPRGPKFGEVSHRSVRCDGSFRSSAPARIDLDQPNRIPSCHATLPGDRSRHRAPARPQTGGACCSSQRARDGCLD